MRNKKDDLLSLKAILSKIMTSLAYDKANGLYDPNHDEEVEDFLARGKLIKMINQFNKKLI